MCYLTGQDTLPRLPEAFHLQCFTAGGHAWQLQLPRLDAMLALQLSNAAEALGLAAGPRRVPQPAAGGILHERAGQGGAWRALQTLPVTLKPLSPQCLAAAIRVLFAIRHSGGWSKWKLAGMLSGCRGGRPRRTHALQLMCAPPDALQAFQSYIKTILTRKNTITGVVYSEDPTIMAVELANEPHTTCAAQLPKITPMHMWAGFCNTLCRCVTINKPAVILLCDCTPQQSEAIVQDVEGEGCAAVCRWACDVRHSPARVSRSKLIAHGCMAATTV